MRSVLQFFGKIIFFCAWPAFWVYFKRGYGRTRVVLRHGDEVLVVKNWISDSSWSLPGGGLHKNEQPVEGAVRELREETGIVLHDSDLQAIGTATYRKYGLCFDFYVFSATVASYKAHKQRIEISALQWVQPHELGPKTVGQDMRLALDLDSQRAGK